MPGILVHVLASVIRIEIREHLKNCECMKRLVDDLVATFDEIEDTKVKVKSYDCKVNTNSHDNGVLKEGSHCVCLAVILIDSAFKMGKNYYL